MTDDATMTIREMCDAFDVTPRTLRFYEAKELLFPIREGQKRLFTRRDRARLKLILRGKRFGFSLEEIRQLLDLYHMGDQQQTQLARRPTRSAAERLADMKSPARRAEHAIAELEDQMRWGEKMLASLTRAARTSRRISTAAPEGGDHDADLHRPHQGHAVRPARRAQDLTKPTSPATTSWTRDFTAAILEEAGKLAENVLRRSTRWATAQGCTLENGVVRTPEGFKDAYDQMREGGWIGPRRRSRIRRPGHALRHEHRRRRDVRLRQHGLQHVPGPDPRRLSRRSTRTAPRSRSRPTCPSMVDGIWSGTMNLTEPHCGTDLGLIRTKAEPQDDGSYTITGQKIWISAGEHDLADNIIHLVLAKIPGGPEGVKGISLFIVPKFLVNEDGSLGERNGVSCGGLEEKMGIHGNATCVMNYDGATGFLIGELHKGMRAMFTMMNEARLGVGLQGYAQAEVAYQNALAYAQDRLQGRDVTGRQEPRRPGRPDHRAPRRAPQPDATRRASSRARAPSPSGARTLIDRAHRNEDEEAEG